MAAARGNKERVFQVAGWLRDNFPTPYPVTLGVVKYVPAPPEWKHPRPKTSVLGETYRDGCKIIIRIAVREGLPRYIILETLMHEWAHATSMRHDCIELRRMAHGNHDEHWALDYGHIYRGYIDGDGAAISGNY
jgi:hypothetical protein